MLRSFSYVTDHPGFCGTIKNSPSDFVVTEMEVPEHLVRDARPESPQTTSKAPLEQSTPRQQQPKKLRTEPPAPRAEGGGGGSGCGGGGGGHDGGDDGDGVPRPSERDPSQAGGSCSASPNKNQREGEPGLKSGLEEASLLDSLLGKPVSDLLSGFAGKLKDAWDSEGDARAGTGEFSLGPVLDKKSRAGLHSAIRQKFPFLLTVTKDNEMIVKGNADYRELCQLVTEKETSDFFRFLDAKLDNSTFCFEPDGNKEHRKVVHHFINRKFGKLLETKSFTVTDVNDQPNMSIMVRFRDKSWSRKRSAGGFQEKQDLYTGEYYFF